MKMQKIPVTELKGAQLNWAVAMALGMNPAINFAGGVDTTQADCRRVGIPDDRIWCGAFGHGSVAFFPSTDWSQGGPILARMIESGEWGAEPWRIGGQRVMVSNINTEGLLYSSNLDEDDITNSFGETLLVAAMRAFVSRKLGDQFDEVEVPA